MEVVCLAIETSTGRQIGRFFRYARVDPPTQKQQQQQPFQAPFSGGGTEGSLNVKSTALPLPELLQELQQWMVSLGLGPGPRDESGFAERGNFRYAV